MKKLNQRQKGDDTDGPCGCYECMPDIGGYKMKHKKLFLGLGAGILAVAIAVGAAFFAGGRNKTVKLEDIKRATTARELLLAHLGAAVFSEGVADGTPEYLVGRYIDEDCKLQIRLHESAKDKEAAIIEALGEYADIAEFNYLSVTERELQVRAADIEAQLKQQGYAVSRVGVNKRTGNISIYWPNEAVDEAEAWVREQEVYPFDDVGIDYIFVFPDDVPFCPGSQQAKDDLVKWLSAAGGYYAYKDYYCGCYIGLDGKLHVVIRENISRDQRKGLETCLQAYSDITVFEYGGYSKEELWVYLDELAEIMKEMGILPTEYGIDSIIELPTMSTLREDLPLLQILLESEAAPRLNGKKIPVILSSGVPARV